MSVDLSAVLRLFTDEFSSRIVPRQVSALSDVCRHYQRGFVVADFPLLEGVIAEAFSALESSGEAFLPACVALLELLGRPYVRTRANEEFSPPAPRRWAACCAARRLR